MPIEPPHTMNPTSRFSAVVQDYRRYRPSYPPAAIDAILDGLGAPERLVALDAGAGTGISARLLAARGIHVIAIEPNEAMRAAGAAQPLPPGAPAGSVQWRDATAEQTGLEAASIDLVLCAQAFHWFRPIEALGEFARVLKPHGRLALMWNKRDETDSFTAEYSRLIRQASSSHLPELGSDPRHDIRAHGGYTLLRLVETPAGQTLDLQGLIGRAMSASYTPKEGPAHERLIEGLHAAHTNHADESGHVTLAYQTRIYLAEVR